MCDTSASVDVRQPLGFFWFRCWRWDGFGTRPRRHRMQRRGGRILLREDYLRFQATPKQRRGSATGTVILAAVAVGLAALGHWRFGFGSVLQQWDIAVAAA